MIQTWTSYLFSEHKFRNLSCKSNRRRKKVNIYDTNWWISLSERHNPPPVSCSFQSIFLPAVSVYVYVFHFENLKNDVLFVSIESFHLFRSFSYDHFPWTPHTISRSIISIEQLSKLSWLQLGRGSAGPSTWRRLADPSLKGTHLKWPCHETSSEVIWYRDGCLRAYAPWKLLEDVLRCGYLRCFLVEASWWLWLLPYHGQRDVSYDCSRGTR